MKMNKLNLKDVTLVCIDDLNTQLSIDIMSGVSTVINFGDVRLFSSSNLAEVTDKIAPINGLEKYSSFLVKDLHKYINTDFCVIMQSDGYPINPKAWTDDFLKYDYIGAPWVFVRGGHRRLGCKRPKPCGKWVGNGGFSLRSTKLLKSVASKDYDGEPWEDAFICRVINEELKAKKINFAPIDLASRFSVEKGVYTGQFGWHGTRATLEPNNRWGIFNFEKHAYESGLPPIGSTINLIEAYSNYEPLITPTSKPIDLLEYE